MENINDVYIFQPVEINNTNASLYDRYVPTEFKGNNIIMKVSLIGNDIIREYQEVSKDLENKLKNVSSVEEEEGSEGTVNDFYTRITKVKGIVINAHRISNNNIEQHVIRRYLDTLHVKEKIILAKCILSDIEGEMYLSKKL